MAYAGNTSTESGTETKINGVSYQRFGKYVFDNSGPVLNSINVTSPNEGTYKAGNVITIVSTYDENVYGPNAGTILTSSTAPTLKIKFGTGTERTATFKSTTRSTITYEYTIVTGDNGALSVSGHTGTVYDRAGNSTSVGIKTIGGNAIIADTTPPVLNSIKVTSPATGAYRAGQAITIVATYSENIYKDENKGVIVAATTALKLKFGTGTERTATFSSASGATITYTYTIVTGDNGVIAFTSYTGDVYDIAGNKLTLAKQDNTGNVITADTIPPTLSNIKVTSPATGIYRAGQAITIVATFSENIYKDQSKGAIVAATTALKLKFGTGTERTATFSSASGSTIT